MENKKNSKGAMRFFGITLFTQAVTALIGGSIFLGPFDESEFGETTLRMIYNSTGVAYTSVLIQIVTAVVIIMLGVAMYMLGRNVSETMAIVALSLYILEAVLLALAQVFAFGLVEVSRLFSISADINLIAIGEIFLVCKSFAGEIAMIPFGIGAILFYYLLLKAEVLPKWLALWGILTVPFILISVPLMSFGINAPFFLLVPYVPFEFFTGIYVLAVNRQK
jgi:hypothetical protein